MSENLSSILNVKLDNNWVEIPALRGSSVYIESVAETSRQITIGGETVTQHGWVITIVDERKAATVPGYEHDTVTLWDGINGSGAVQTVDDQGIQSGTTNIQLNAVSYGRVQSLNTEQALQARTNINAQVAGNYIASPTNKVVNQFLKYLGNDSWATATVQVLPESASTGVLVKTTSSMDSLAWMSALTTTEIDNIIANS